MIERVRRRLRGAADTVDAGFTLIELIVAMGIFLVFVAIFLSAVVNLTRGTTRSSNVAQSTSSLLVVFQNIDRQVRYADAINRPGNGTGGNRYIEFRVPAVSTTDRVTRCYQWRYNATTGVISSRSWADVAGSAKTSWSTKIESVISVTGSDYPFAMIPASSTVLKQQFQLTVSSGISDADTDISTKFVARNSSIDSISNLDANADGSSDSPVCLTTGDRP